MKINLLLRKIYLNFFFRSKLIASLFFKTKFLERDKDAYYFDITTFFLIKTLLKNLKKDTNFFDLGTGTSCLIGIEIKKRIKCNVIASDINKEIVQLAKKNVEFNKIDLAVYESNFFENIDLKFDVISFNPPYVASNLGKKISLSEKFRSQWDGGKNSDEILIKFFTELDKLDKKVTCYLGMNTQHLGKDFMKNLVKKYNNLEIVKVYNYFLFPVNVYVINKS